MLRGASSQAIVERIRRAELAARITGARIGLHIAEVLGDWGFIEMRHRRLLDLEIEQWRRGWDD